MDPKVQALREKLQNEIVNIVTNKLESGQINESRAKEIAQFVLEKLPRDISYQKLMEIIPTLDDHFEELTNAVLPIMVEYEQRMKKIIDEKIRSLIALGKLDEALNVARKAIEFEKSLS